MVNYGNGKIYKLVSDNNPELVYIGSTTKKYLSQRLTEHVNQYRLYTRGFKVSKLTSFRVIETGNYSIVLLELFPCSCKDELHKRERWYIENTANCINKCIPTRTIKEYREATKTEYKEYQKEHYQKNKEVIQEKRKQRYNDNKEYELQKMKEYRAQNVDKLKEYDAKRNAIKSICSCGGQYTTTHKKRHERTNKHQQYINQQEQQANE